MATEYSCADRYVTVPIPGIIGVSLIYDLVDPGADPPLLESAVVILGHWLKQRAVTLNPAIIRNALRHLNVPHLLSETELAYVIFDGIHPSHVRGTALQSLLLDTLAHLDPGPNATAESRRRYHILGQLYIERKQRLHILRDLGLSERQYQRELRNALVRLTEVLTGRLYPPERCKANSGE